MKAAILGFFAFQISKKAKSIIIGIIISIVILALIIAAVLASILRVDYLHNAILINTAENRINSGIYTNVAIVKGWNFNFVTFPNGKFQIAFRDSTQDKKNSYFFDKKISVQFPSIVARTIQGTKLKFDIYANVQITVQNQKYSQFYQIYGKNWIDYLQYKIPNIIRRYVSNCQFYNFNNSGLIAATAGNLTFESFKVEIINIQSVLASKNKKTDSTADSISNITIPQTLGQQLLNKRREYYFLNQTYNNINSFIASTQSQILNNFGYYGNLQAIRDSYILSATADTTLWVKGLNILYTNLLNKNSGITQNFLWTYFQSQFNKTFVYNRTKLQYM